MEPSENPNKTPLNPVWNQEQTEPSEGSRRKTPWLLAIAFVILAGVVTGLVWHDLRRAYDGTIANWRVVLTNSADDRVGLADLWLREREMNAKFIAANPSTVALLKGGAKAGNAAETRRDVERDLNGTTAANGLLAGIVVDLQCQIVARAGMPGAEFADLKSICKPLYGDKKFHVIASGLDQGMVRLGIAVPVFTEVKSWPSGQKIHPIVGMVVLIADPWKTLLTYLAPGGEPAKTIETSVVWKRDKNVVVFNPAREERGAKSVFVQPLTAMTFEARAAAGGNMAFGEFTDYRGVRVFGVAKEITQAGDHLALKIDRDEALADFRRQSFLEGFAGILMVLLFGFLAAAVHRRVATRQLIEKLNQKEALLMLKKDVEISEKRYRDLFENANDVILTLDLDNQTVSINKSGERLTGYTRDELAGRSAFELIAPEYHEHLRQITQSLIEGKRVPPHEVVLIAKDGHRVFVEANRQLVYEDSRPVGIQVIARDITDRKRAEKELQAEKAFSDAVVDSLPGAFYVIDEKGRLVRWNKSAEGVGYSAHELAAMEPSALFTPEDRSLIAAKWQQAFTDGGAMAEAHILAKDGRKIPYLFTAQRAEIGDHVYVIGTGIDMTERKQMLEALRHSEQRYRDFISHSAEGVWRFEFEKPIPLNLPAEEVLKNMGQLGYLAECNDALARILGADSAADLIGVRYKELLPPSDADWIDRFRSLISSGFENRTLEFHFIDHKGNPKDIQRTEIPIVENGMVLRLWGITRDITERKQMGEALRKSEQRYRDFFSHTLEGLWRVEFEPPIPVNLPEEEMLERMYQCGYMAECNEAQARLAGWSSAEEKIGAHLGEIIPRSNAQGVERVRSQIRSGIQNRGLEFHYIDQQGVPRDVYRIEIPIVEDGLLKRFWGLTRDITDRKKAEEELRISEERYRTLIEGAPEAIVVNDFETGKFVDFNENAMHLFGLSKEELLKVGPIELSPPFQPDGRPSSQAAIELIKSALAGESPVFEWVHRNAHGQDIPCEVRVVRLPAAGRTLVRGSITDITARKLAEEERSRLASIVESSGDAILGASPEGLITFWNVAAEKVYGYSAAEIHGRPVSILAPNHGTAEILNLLEKIMQGERISDLETFHVRQDGTQFPVSITLSATRDRQGAIVGFSGIIRDITLRKRLEAQITLGQKMESVGRLAGGVAHDFNNMLQIINGYSELVLDQLAPEDLLRGHVQEIKTIVERAAGLTRQLLAFGRQQVLAPRVMDLNVAITHLSKMLRRLIGEDIELVITEGSALDRVKADPGQIDQVMMNLVVNARDAMPRGGKLSIETSNVQVNEGYAQGHFPMPPGAYVMISVSDTGHGMDAKTQARIFEPFFTTKETGKGTGLGLATVYGIIKQSDGYIWVQSEVGQGTTFRIYLPPVKEAATAEAVKATPAMAGGTETVLVVEDEEKVRTLVRRALQAKGYRVLEASNGEDALRIAGKHHAPIDLLITDVVMPGMGGPELADRLGQICRGMKTVFMSGYAHDAIHQHGALDSGAVVLQKPFSVDAMASKVREALERA